MLGSAVLIAEQMVISGLRSFEPHFGVAAWNHVHLRAKCGHVEVMNHILGDEGHAHRHPNRNVKVVDLALSSRVLELPHPLLADAVDRHRRFGSMSLLEEK